MRVKFNFNLGWREVVHHYRAQRKEKVLFLLWLWRFWQKSVRL